MIRVRKVLTFLVWLFLIGLGFFYCWRGDQVGVVLCALAFLVNRQAEQMGL